MSDAIQIVVLVVVTAIVVYLFVRKGKSIQPPSRRSRD